MERYSFPRYSYPLAFAFTGCNKSQMLFDMLLKSLKDKSNLKVEDALQYIKKTYRFCKILWFRKFSKEILGLGSQFLVVGKNRNDECCIYAVLISHGKLEKPLLKEWLILPPHGGLTDIVHIFVFCIIDRDFDDIKFIFGSVRWNWLVLCA